MVSIIDNPDCMKKQNELCIKNIQNTPHIVADNYLTFPTYLVSPGIQVGPGVDLVTKSAGSRPFSTYIYPTIVYYGLWGIFNTGTGGYL